MVSYRFFIRLSDGYETERDETAESFRECLKKAEYESEFMNGKVIAWDSLNDVD